MYNDLKENLVLKLLYSTESRYKDYTLGEIVANCCFYIFHKSEVVSVVDMLVLYLFSSSCCWAFTWRWMCYSFVAHAASEFSHPQMLRVRTTVECFSPSILFLCVAQRLLFTLYLNCRGCIFDEKLAGKCNDFIISFVRHDDVGKFLYSKIIACLLRSD